MSSLPPPLRRPNIDTQCDVQWVPAPLLTAQDHAWLAELLTDATKSHRVTGWLASFVADMEIRHRRFARSLILTQKQKEVLRKIESLIHAT